MKNEILSYIEKSKNRYTTYIKNDINLLNRINDNITLSIDLKEKCYLILNELLSPPHCPCGNETKFIGIREGYTTYCSSKCIVKLQERIKSAQYAYKQDDIRLRAKEKLKKTMKERYGVEHNSKILEVKEKRKKTFLNNYGVDNPAKSLLIQNKIKTTNLKRYGVESPLHSAIIQNKIKTTNLKRYGVENPLQSKDIRNKIKTTNLERYGVENPLQSKDIRNKIKTTNLERYGSKFSTQKHFSKEQLDILNDSDLFFEFCNKYENTTSAITDLKVDRTTFLNYVKLYNLKDKLKYNFYSWPELQIKEFIESLGINALYEIVTLKPSDL